MAISPCVVPSRGTARGVGRCARLHVQRGTGLDVLRPAVQDGRRIDGGDTVRAAACFRRRRGLDLEGAQQPIACAARQLAPKRDGERVIHPWVEKPSPQRRAFPCRNGIEQGDEVLHPCLTRGRIIGRDRALERGEHACLGAGRSSHRR